MSAHIKKPIDDIDRKLLALLTENARTPINQLACQVGRSRAVIYERIAKLERLGYIDKYTITAKKDLTLHQSQIRAYLLLTLDGPICKQVAPRIIHFPEVKFSRSISGMIDMILYVEVNDMVHLSDVRMEIEAVEGVKNINTLPILMDHFDRS